MPARCLAGEGRIVIEKPADEIRKMLLDPRALMSLIPNALSVTERSPGKYAGALTFGLGPLQGIYAIVMNVTETTPCVFNIKGASNGRLGQGEASASLSLRTLQSNHTEITWNYAGTITGPISLIGNRLQTFAARNFIDRFFARLAGY